MFNKVIVSLPLVLMLAAAAASPAPKGAGAITSHTSGGEVTPRVPPPATVVVMVNRVRRLDPMDPPPDTRADFFVRVTIGDSENTSPVSESRDDVTPQWTFTHEVSGERVPITIKLFDKDEAGPDDHCDINPRVKATDISVNYNLVTGHVTGDAPGLAQKLIRVHGAAPDSKKAEIWFTVYRR